MFQQKEKTMPPPKMAVMIGIGKPKGEEEGGKPKSPMMGGAPKPKGPPMPQHEEPDEDQMGGASDNDADNRIGENIDLIQQHIPAAIHPIANLIEAIADFCRKGAGGGMGMGMEREEPGEEGY